jgi:hypothetical protein
MEFFLPPFKMSMDGFAKGSPPVPCCILGAQPRGLWLQFVQFRSHLWDPSVDQVQVMIHDL